MEEKRQRLNIGGRLFVLRSSWVPQGYIHLLNKMGESSIWHVPTIVVRPDGIYYLDPEKDANRIISKGDADKISVSRLKQVKTENGGLYFIPLEFGKVEATGARPSGEEGLARKLLKQVAPRLANYL